ncbi:MAG: TIM barrel protein [Pseudomonadota bacterium]
MFHFSANLTFLYGELDFKDRFPAARRDGFRFVELAFPYDLPARSLAGLLEENGLKQVLLNMPPGNLAAGELGLASDPDRVADFRRGVDLALEYAVAVDAPMINCLAGRRLSKYSLVDQRRVLVENLVHAAARLAEEGRTLNIEPLNDRDFPGFLLTHSDEAVRIIAEAGAPNLRLQFDLYHMQKMEGDLIGSIRRHFAHIGHVQVGDNPDRMPPGTGEINVPNVIRELERLGYAGLVGLEYFAVPDTPSAIKWLDQAGFKIQ